jgi:hypothetical protein
LLVINVDESNIIPVAIAELLLGPFSTSLPNSWSTECEEILSIIVARVTPVVVVKVGEGVVVAENGGNGLSSMRVTW